MLSAAYFGFSSRSTIGMSHLIMAGAQGLTKFISVYLWLLPCLSYKNPTYVLYFTV